MLHENQVHLKKALLKIDGTLSPQQIKCTKDAIKIMCTSDEQKLKFLQIQRLINIEVEVTEHFSVTRPSADYTDYDRVIIFGVPTHITSL